MYVYKGISVLIAGGLFITSEQREDHIHFLVFTDVCGNRTYGVVAQYYQPMQVCYLTHAFTEIYLKVMSGVFLKLVIRYFLLIGIQNKSDFIMLLSFNSVLF